MFLAKINFNKVTYITDKKKDLIINAKNKLSINIKLELL